METLTDGKFCFGNFELDRSRRQLNRDGRPVTLKPKTFDLLQYLVENHGKLVTKTELMDHVWPGQFVEENNLTVQISALRKVFADTNGSPRLITTVPGKGYTFVGEVFEVEPTGLIIEQRTVSRITIDEHQTLSNGNPLRAENPAVNSWSSLAIVGLATGVVLLFAVLGLVYWQRSSMAGNAEFTLTKLTTSGDITTVTITPDGRYAVFARREIEGESLWLRQIATGNHQQILAARPVRFVGLAVSPDGSSIYASTFSPKLPDPQVWQMPLLGGAVNEINGLTTGAAVSFSPDGQKIAFTESRSSMKQTQLLTSNADGSDKKVIARSDDGIRSFPNFNSNPVAWSPDGKIIAAAVAENLSGVKHRIRLIDPATGTDWPISERHWDFIDNLVWIDSENLAFIAYTSDPWLGQVWSISRTTGEARRITNDLGNYAWIAAGGGKLLTLQRNSMSHIALVDIDEKFSLVHRREIFTDSGGIDNIGFTAGGTLLYSSNTSGRREIWTINPDGTGAKQITSNASVAFGMSISRLDGSIVFGATENGRYVLKIVDSEGRDQRLLTDGPDDLNPEFSPDGQTVYFQKGLNNQTITIWRLNLADKTQTQLTQTNAIQPAVSPDGTQIAYYFMDADEGGIWKIGAISTVDASFAGKMSFPKPVSERRMRWLADGSGIGQIFNEGDKINLITMPTIGNQPKTLYDLGKGDAQSLAFSRDGRQLAISYAEQRPDVVMLSR